MTEMSWEFFSTSRMKFLFDILTLVSFRPITWFISDGGDIFFYRFEIRHLRDAVQAPPWMNAIVTISVKNKILLYFFFFVEK